MTTEQPGKAEYVPWSVAWSELAVVVDACLALLGAVGSPDHSASVGLSVLMASAATLVEPARSAVPLEYPGTTPNGAPLPSPSARTVPERWPEVD